MKLLVVLLTITAAFAGPVRNYYDEVECDKTSRFKEGQKYFYQYEAQTTSGIVGASERRTGMRIICDVQVEVPQRCQLYVSTPKCELLEQNPESKDSESFRLAPNTREFSREMARNSLKVEVNKGKVTRIQPHVDEPVHILNMKRGIMSTLQLPIDDELYQEQYPKTQDVFGNCTAETKILDIRSGNQIRKVQLNKDLSNCTRPNKTFTRESPLSLLRNISMVQKMVNSTQNCTYTMSSNGYVKEVICVEMHTLWPMSANNSGVQTNVSQILTRANKPEKINIAKAKDDSSRRITNITYEFEVEPEPMNKTMNTTLKVLFELVNKTVNETTIEAPRLFNKLVASLRALDNETLHNLLPVAWNCSEHGNCSTPREQELARSYIIDALPQCGTWPCISVIATALVNSTINGTRADVLLYALAFEPNPSLQVVNETLRIADVLRTRPAMLTLGTLIHNYVSNNKTIEEKRKLPEPITRSVELMSKIIGDNCSPFANEVSNSEKIEYNRQILLALKTIGNMGKPIQIYDESKWLRSSKVLPKLIRCAESAIVPRNVSLAAIQAMRRMDPTEELREELMNVLEDATKDVEMRLASYLLLMKNPSTINLHKIVGLLKQENMLQVRAFVASHITSILESEEPTLKIMKEKLRNVLSTNPLPEVEHDLMKLSRHMEFSKAFKLPWINQTVAAQLQSNLIYSPEGLLPRSLVLNMTVNILGKSLNVFETGLDVQGMEPLLEGLFGPQGYFPDWNLIALFKNLTGNDPADMLRKKERDIKYNKYNNEPYRKMEDKIKKFKEPEFLANKIHNALNDLHDDVSHMQLPPAASAYIKVLGNELGFANLDDLKNLIPNLTLSDIPSISTILKKLADGIDYNITRSYMFLEANHVLPTGMGLPLNISLNGTTVVSLRLAGKFDMRKYIQQDIVASGLIAPSAAVEVVGRFGVNIPLYGESGVQVNSTMYHSSELAGNITLKGTELRFNINKTMKPINLINVSAEQYLVRGEKVERLPGMKENRTEWTNCTSSLLNTTALFGLDLCTSLAYSNASYDTRAPRFPLTGPTSFNMTVVPTDANLTAYTLLMKYQKIVRPVAEEKPVRKYFGLRRQKQVAEIIDMIVVNFTAPGQNLTRNISSLLTLNRNKTELVWNFTIPELKNISMAAGVQNFSEPMKNLTQFVASFNATYGCKNFSNWIRVRNETLNITRIENGREIIIPVNNYSYAWNISLNDLFFSVESDVVNKTGNWSSTFNVTYYWDDKTPMLDQLRPEYSIKPENYSKFLVDFEHVNKSLSNETLLESKLNLTFGRQNITLILSRWNNTQNATKAMNASWVNNGEKRTMNITYEYKNRSEAIIEKIERVWNMSLPNWHVALLSQVVNTSIEFNTTLNFTIYSQNKTLKEDVAKYSSRLRQKYIDTFGEEAYTYVPNWYNASMAFAIRNDTVPSSKPYPEVITTSFNISVMNPFNKTNIQNLTIIGKLVNDSRVNNANISYWTNWNITLPLINSNISINASVLNNTQGIVVSYNISGNNSLITQNFTSILNYTHSSYNVSMVFNLTGSLFNMSMNHTILNSTESGLVWLFNSTGSTNYTLPINNFTIPIVDKIREMIPESVTEPLKRLNISIPIPNIIGNISLPVFNISIPLNRTLQLFNHSMQSNVTIKASNISISLNASHPLFNLNLTNQIIKDGPAVNVTLYKMWNATFGEALRMANATVNRTLDVVKSMNLTKVNLTMVKDELAIYKDRLQRWVNPLNITFLDNTILKPIRKMKLPELQALRAPLMEMTREVPKMVDELTPEPLKKMVMMYTPAYIMNLNITNITMPKMVWDWEYNLEYISEKIDEIKTEELRESLMRMVNVTINSTMTTIQPVREIVMMIFNSSMNSTTFINFTSPYIANATLNHTMQLNATMMNHTLFMNMTSKPANLTVNGTLLMAYNSTLEPNSTFINSTLYVNMTGPIANMTMNNTFYLSSNSSLEPNSTVLNHTLSASLSSAYANLTANHTLYISTNCSSEPNSTVLNHTLTTNLTSLLANMTMNHTLYISTNSSLEPNSTVLNHTLSANLTSILANLTMNHTLYISSNSSLEPNSTVLNHTLSANLTSILANLTMNHTLYISSNSSLEPNSTVLNHTLVGNLTSVLANLTVNHTLYISTNCSLEPNSTVMNHTLIANLTSALINGSVNHTLYISSNCSMEPNSTVLKHYLLGNVSTPLVNASVNHTLYISTNCSLEPNSTVLNHTLQANVTSKVLNMSLDHDFKISSNSSLVPNATLFNHTLFWNMTTPFANVTVNSTFQALNLTILNQTFFINVTGPLVNISLNQTMKNDSVFVNVTAPGYGCISLIGQMNNSLINVTLMHQNASHPQINVTDLAFFLSLNRSDVIYANLTWHPRILNHTLNLLNTSFVMANTTVNRTIDLFVKPVVNEIINVTTNYTLRVWELVKNVSHNETSLINQVIREFGITNHTIFELVNYTVTNFTQIANRTINMTIEFAKNLTMETPLYNWTYFALNVTKNVTGTVSEVYNISMSYLNNTLPGWLYRYYEVNRMINEIKNISHYERLALQVWNATEQQVPKTVKYLVNTALSQVAVIGNNSIAVNISHPFNWTSFRSFPNMTEGQWQIILAQYNLVKTMTKRIPYLSRHLLFPKMPDFVKTAMIFGDKHVYTFDGRYYEIPKYENSKCLYVLARDFVDKNFTLLSSENTITLITRDCAVEIDNNNVVRIDGSQKIKELPYKTQNGNVTVTRKGDYVNVTTVYGISLLCDSKNFNCMVNISGWYRNKTLGLLGTSDNEPSNDWRKRDGRNTSNIIDFLNSYEVSGNPSCKKNPGRDPNYIGWYDRPCNSPPSPLCEVLFKSHQSPFAPCFDEIKPEPFMTACKTDSSECQLAEPQKAICTSTAAYVAMCRAKGVFLNQTNECEKCADGARERVLNERWIEDNKLTADIILVVSESEKMTVEGRPEEQLKNFVSSLEKKMQENGIADNRYMLIGYGGSDVHAPAHQHTIRGNLYGDENNFYKGAKALKFQGKYATDAFEALKLATEAKFRPQASRLVILVTEDERSAVNTSLSIESLQSLFEENAIILNVISEYSELYKGKRIFGITHDQTIISGKDKATFKLLDRVGESYAKLSSATRGSLYRLDMMRNNDEDYMKKVPGNVVKQIKYEVEKTYKRCQCVRDADGRSVSKCESLRT
ncbi:uncharacterized protein LOC144437068 [Glandiceps talaboti]